MNSINRAVTLMFHTVVYQKVQCVQSRRGQIYGQDSGPILHTLQRVFYQSVYNMTTSKGGQSPTSVIPWKLRKSSVLWNFLYPNPEYPETSLTLGTPRTYPIAPAHSIHFRRPPYVPQTSGGHPTGRDCPTVPQHTQRILASGTGIPMVPSIHSL